MAAHYREVIMRVLLASVLLLTACASTDPDPSRHQDTSAEKFKFDSFSCRQEVGHSWNSKERYRDCMRSKGWTVN